MRKLSCVLLLLLPLAPPVGAATLLDAKIGFSADRTLTVDGKTYQGKIWAMPGKERHEQAIQGMRPVFLLRADSPFGEVVLASLKTIVQFEIPAELRLLSIAELKRDPVGQEVVNGIATTKYKIEKAVGQGRASGMLWLSGDGIPMRLAGSFTAANGKVSTISWELKRVKTGPQPAALFTSPAGLSRLPPEAAAPLLGLKLKSVRGQ